MSRCDRDWQREADIQANRFRREGEASQPTETPAPSVEALRQTAVLAVGAYFNFPTTLNRQRIYACIDDLAKAATNATARAERTEAVVDAARWLYQREGNEMISAADWRCVKLALDALDATARADSGSGGEDVKDGA